MNVSPMYINELRRFFGFRPRIAYCHFARSCARLPVRLRGRRISLHDSTKIAISGEKSKCRKILRCRRIFLYLFVWTEGRSSFTGRPTARPVWKSAWRATAYGWRRRRLRDCSESTERLLSDMSTTFISRANWSGKQHVQKLHMFSMRGYGKCGVWFHIITSIWFCR